MNLKEFYDLLDKADWYFEQCDDYATYKKGQQEVGQLRGLAQTYGGKFLEMFDGFELHKYSGMYFAETKQPKPVRPV